MSVRGFFQVIVLSLAAIFGQLAVAAADIDDQSSVPAKKRPVTTYERFLPIAVAGDPTIQHFLGYMFFYGEGVVLNYDEAHYWFHLAADEGDVRAQRNLGVFHSRAIERVPEKFYDPVEANLWLSLAAANPQNSEFSLLAAESYERFLPPDARNFEKFLNPDVRNFEKLLTPDSRNFENFLISESGSVKSLKNEKNIGEALYLSTCAGCHGFDGISAYPGVPSFAAGERLEKSDKALIAGISKGKGMMPPWIETLSADMVVQILAHIRNEFGREPEAQPVAQSPPVDSDQLALGEQVYLKFCGGCHGFNGIAWYVNSPSFALRERLDKSDEELTHSIKNGRGAMPSWEYMLKPHQIDALVKFVRTLALTYESGIVGELRRPRDFLQFRPKGGVGANWTIDDLR